MHAVRTSSQFSITQHQAHLDIECDARMTTSPLHYLRYVILVLPQVLVTIGEAVHAIPVALAPPVLATVVAVVGALQDGRKKVARKAVTSAPAELLPAPSGLRSCRCIQAPICWQRSKVTTALLSQHGNPDA